MIILFWIGFAVVVGVGANTRGRNGPGWGLLALVISPLLAGLLLLALPRGDPTVKRVSNWEHWKEMRLTTDNKSFYTGVSVWVVLLLIVGIGLLDYKSKPISAVAAQAAPAVPAKQMAPRQEREVERQAKFAAVKRGDISFCEAFKSELREFTGIRSPCLK